MDVGLLGHNTIPNVERWTQGAQWVQRSQRAQEVPMSPMSQHVLFPKYPRMTLHDSKPTLDDFKVSPIGPHMTP